MVKRQIGMNSWKRYVYAAFALFVLIACWESNKMEAAFATPDIPQDAIRMRILANSDSVIDQWIKRQVRDAVIDQVTVWASEPQSIEEARDMVRSRLPELETVVGRTLNEYGFSYDYKVELDTVPFPAKVWGAKVYPAGQYEALRVTLGKGEGQNWWCVLFPPLCFMGGQIVSKKEADEKSAQEEAAKAAKAKPAAATAGKNAAAGSGKTDAAKQAGKPSGEKPEPSGTVKAASASANESAAKSAADGQPEIEVRFFLWDMVKKWFA